MPHPFALPAFFAAAEGSIRPRFGRVAYDKRCAPIALRPDR